MTPLSHNPAITVIDLPEDAVMVRLNPVHSIIQWKEKAFEDRTYWDTKHIPPSIYKLICLGLQATEDEAREIVECYNHEAGEYKDYEYPGNVYFTPTASLASLITANGWKNPVFLRKEN